MKISHMTFRSIIVCLFTITVLLPFTVSAGEYISLSDYFAVKNINPFFGKKYTEVFVREGESGKYTSIGTTENSHWDKPFSGAALEALEMSVMAISLDGKSLLYRYQGSRKKEGIYWYRIGLGDKLLYPEENLKRFWSKLPSKNVMVLKSSAWPSEDEWALSADDASLKPLALLGSTPLHMAVYQNNLNEVYSFIDQGVDINSKNYWGFTPLEIAVKKGFDKIAILLIDKGADYSHKTKDFLSAIQLAVYLQRWHVIEAIDKKGGRLNSTGLIRYAMMRNYSQLMRDDKSSYQPDDSQKMIELILMDGADPNSGEESIIYHLLEKSYKGGTRGKLGSLKLLLKFGADPLAVESSNRNTPLHLMVSHSVRLDIGWQWNEETREIIDLLVSNMKTLEVKNKFGATALQTSMSGLREAGDFNKALYLIEVGADDSAEYLCGAMGRPSGMSIRQIIEAWGNSIPDQYDCSGNK